MAVGSERCWAPGLLFTDRETKNVLGDTRDHIAEEKASHNKNKKMSPETIAGRGRECGTGGGGVRIARAFWCCYIYLAHPSVVSFQVISSQVDPLGAQ